MSLILFCVLWASWICVLVSHIIIWGNHQSLLLQIFLPFLVFLAFLFFWHSHYTYVEPFVIVQQFLDILFPACPPHPPPPSLQGFFFPVYLSALEDFVYIVSSLESLPLAVFSLTMSPSKLFFISVICFWSVPYLFYFLSNFYLFAYVTHLFLLSTFFLTAFSVFIVILNYQSDNSNLLAISETSSDACSVFSNCVVFAF